MSKIAISKTNPVAPYLGGKRNLAKRICAIIDDDEHITYAEPFVGMGGIFLRRSSRPKAEFINDVPEIRETFAKFHMVEVSTTYTIAAKNDRSKERAELLISNFKWENKADAS